jgi:phage tail-like protein
MSDAYNGCRFIVTLDVADTHLPSAQIAAVPPMPMAGFQEVSGLSAQLEVLSHAEGGENDHVHQLPVRHSWGRISLKRGITNDIRLWLWYQAGLFQSLGARRDGAVTLLAEDGTPAMAWLFRGGLAAKWEGPVLNAGQSAISIEAMEIAHEGLFQVPLTAG